MLLFKVSMTKSRSPLSRTTVSAVMRSSSTNTSAIPFSAPNRISSWGRLSTIQVPRSEEHTSELQSRFELVCRLLLEKKKIGPDKDVPAPDVNNNEKIMACCSD